MIEGSELAVGGHRSLVREKSLLVVIYGIPKLLLQHSSWNTLSGLLQSVAISLLLLLRHLLHIGLWSEKDGFNDLIVLAENPLLVA